METDEFVNDLLEKYPRGARAAALFREGYNCSQSLAIAFEDMLGYDRKTLAKIVSGYGGGMGRLREVCGSFSGLVFILSNLYGYDDPKDYEGKKELYARIQELAKRVSAVNGSIVCKELLGLSGKPLDPVPEKRTDEYYKKRPCDKIIGVTAALLEQYLEEVKNG